MSWFGSRSAGAMDKPSILREIQQSLPAIVQLNSQRANWPGRLTGIYGEAAVSQTAGLTDYGILVLLETAGRVVGISTTNNSFWVGSVRSGRIEATYINQHGTTGTLSLQLASDGSYVAGSWRVQDASGAYKAHRTASFDQATVMSKLEGIPVR